MLRLVNSQRDPSIVKKNWFSSRSFNFFYCMDLKLILVFSWISSSLFHFYLWISCWSFIFAWLYSYLASSLVFFYKKKMFSDDIFHFFTNILYKIKENFQYLYTMSIVKSCHNSILTIFSNLFFQIKYIKE